jgi:hypothetical protein
MTAGRLRRGQDDEERTCRQYMDSEWDMRRINVNSSLPIKGSMYSKIAGQSEPDRTMWPKADKDQEDIRTSAASMNNRALLFDVNVTLKNVESFYIKPNDVELSENELRKQQEEDCVPYIIRFRQGHSNGKMVLAFDPKVKEAICHSMHATQTTCNEARRLTSIPYEHPAWRRDIDKQVELAHKRYGQRLIQDVGRASQLLRAVGRQGSTAMDDRQGMERSCGGSGAVDEGDVGYTSIYLTGFSEIDFNNALESFEGSNSFNVIKNYTGEKRRILERMFFFKYRIFHSTTISLHNHIIKLFEKMF